MIDLHDLALEGVAPPRKSEKAPRHRAGERFLRGPIPMAWLCAASRASGQGSGFNVGIAIWYLSGLNKQAGTIKLSGSVLREMGIERHAGYRGVRALEAAGLVRVEHRPGKVPLVTILDVDRPGEGR